MIDRLRHAGVEFNAVFRDWVHPTVRGDEVLKARHSSLIASHMLGGSVSAFVFAGYFAWVGAPGAATLIAALCFLSPIGIALFLSRTGRLEIAHLMSAAQLTALVTLAAALSGGTQSFALVWLVLVPLEAALSADRRMMILATALAVAALGGLHLATVSDALPAAVALPVSPVWATFATCLGAVAYAGALAANVQQMHRGAARELETSRERYRLIAENANDLITRHEASGGISFASLASRSLLGVGPEALIKHGFAGCLAPGDRERYQNAISACLTTGSAAAEEFLVANAGSTAVASRETWIEMRCQRVEAGMDPQSGMHAVIAVTRDVTIAKAKAIELFRAREEAERASRAKTAFLTTMSHELRTPLSAIIGFAEILHRELLIKAREPKHADYCRVIHQSGEHLLSLVKDLLDVSRIESGNLNIVPEPFSLNEVAISALETLRPQADAKRISLVSNLDSRLPELLADRRATKQILINLLSNAVKFTTEGGHVAIAAKAVGRSIEISVTDDGIGVAPEHLTRIAQPFYQVETSYARQNEGVGLGLSIVRGLVDLHQGEFRIESEPGRGSRFIVVLPADIDADDAIESPAVIVVAPQPRIVDLAEIHAHRQRLQQNQEPMPAAAGTSPPRLAVAV